MPTVTVGEKTGEFGTNKRLVLAIEELGVQIGHRCGGQARCTTCRVEFLSGEPDGMTLAEYRKLKERELLGQYRLSCQLTCSHDMVVRPAMTLESEGWDDTGPDPDPEVQPVADWLTQAELIGDESV